MEVAQPVPRIYGSPVSVQHSEQMLLVFSRNRPRCRPSRAAIGHELIHHFQELPEVSGKMALGLAVKPDAGGRGIHGNQAIPQREGKDEGVVAASPVANMG